MGNFRFLLYTILPLLIIGCNKRLESQNSGGNTQLDTTVIASGLEVPWEILWGPDNHIWLTERSGRVLRINTETKQKQLLIEIDVTQQGESGLLGMALHPDFTTTPFVYLVYTYSQSGIKERLSRFIYQQGQLVNEEILINNITGNTYHDGSRLLFGSDGKLYMTTGEAGDMPLSQDPNSFNGKLLRINPDGSIPDDNPITGSYVWALGFRNSQGLDQSESGILYSSEHGPDSDDEINILESGRNYGWPDVRGMCDTPYETIFCNENNVREPIQIYTPTLALAGISYYNHDLIPEWNNSLIVSSLKAGQLLILHLDEQGLSVTNSTTVYNNTLGRLRDVCVSNDGRVFFSTSNRDGRGNPQTGDDKIIEIKPANPNSIKTKDKTTSFIIYPNPARDQIKADITQNFREGNFRVFDTQGKLRLKGNNYIISRGLDVSNLTSGLYNIVIENEHTYVISSFLIL